MECPDCRYVLSSFDQVCPRCKHFQEKGTPTASLPAESVETTTEREGLEYSSIRPEYTKPGFFRSPEHSDHAQALVSKMMDNAFADQERRRKKSQAAPFYFAGWVFLVMGIILSWVFPVGLFFFALALIMSVIGMSKRNG